MTGLLTQFKEFFGLVEPETVTVKIPLKYGKPNEYCEISYIARNEVMKRMALQMADKGYEASKGRHFSLSNNLLEIEREIGLKRYDPAPVHGEIIPAYKRFSHFFGESVTCEYWRHGNRAEFYGVHSYGVDRNGRINERDLCSVYSNPFVLEDKGVKARFIAHYELMQNKAATQAVMGAATLNLSIPAPQA